MESFLLNNHHISNVQLNTTFEISDEQEKRLAELLDAYSLNTTPKLLFKFFERAISNKIVLIERADPGYDFIFSSEILGIVTKYGGSNSHLALRCTELAIPAAIGCDDLVDKSYIILNCKDQKNRICLLE